jgi:hypothetical protein
MKEKTDACCFSLSLFSLLSSLSEPCSPSSSSSSSSSQPLSLPPSIPTAGPLHPAQGHPHERQRRHHPARQELHRDRPDHERHGLPGPDLGEADRQGEDGLDAGPGPAQRDRLPLCVRVRPDERPEEHHQLHPGGRRRRRHGGQRDGDGAQLHEPRRRFGQRPRPGDQQRDQGAFGVSFVLFGLVSAAAFRQAGEKEREGKRKRKRKRRNHSPLSTSPTNKKCNENRRPTPPTT